jgi:hypothetical protein
MTTPSRSIPLVLLVLLASIVPARAEPAKCQKTISKQMQKLGKKHIQQLAKCLDKENVGKIPGPCPDAQTDLKISQAVAATAAKIAADCTLSDLGDLGFSGTCELEPASGGVEAGCFALPVTNMGEFATCLQCWQAAEISELVATLYASHAEEVCGGDLGETSPVCSALDFTTPLPDQRNLTDGGEADCQKAIGKGGFKYLVLREKSLANCALGATQAECLADPSVQVKVEKASLKLETLVGKKCGNRIPDASPPFCCRTGQANMCTAGVTREDCENVLLGQVQEGKICDVDDTCANPPGNVKSITWWENCPEGGAALEDLDDLESCVETVADTIIDELLCMTFPRNSGVDWPCPPEGSPSGAFVDGAVLF